MRGHPPHPTQITEGLCQGLGLAEVVEQPLDLAETVERNLEFEPEIDGLLARIAALGEVLQGSQRLLKTDHRLPVG